MVLNEIKAGQTPKEVDLSNSPFWVKVYDVPIGFRTKAIARRIGGASGNYLTWDSNEVNRLWCFLKIRIAIDISKPLKRVI